MRVPKTYEFSGYDLPPLIRERLHIQHVAADNYGGLVAVFADGSPQCCNHLDDAIRRIDSTGRVAWEYVQLARTGRLSDVALHPDGRVFVVERRDPTASNLLEIRTDLVALDGETGAELGRWELGWSPTPTSRYPLEATGPIVLEDGSIAVVAHRFEGTVGRLVRFSMANGVLTEHAITGPSLGGSTFLPLLRRLTPDGHGGLLVAADNTATIYRVSDQDTLVGPLELGVAPNTGTDHVVQMALGENGAVALVQDWWGSGSYELSVGMLQRVSVWIRSFNRLVSTASGGKFLPSTD